MSIKYIKKDGTVKEYRYYQKTGIKPGPKGPNSYKLKKRNGTSINKKKEQCKEEYLLYMQQLEELKKIYYEKSNNKENMNILNCYLSLMSDICYKISKIEILDFDI